MVLHTITAARTTGMHKIYWENNYLKSTYKSLEQEKKKKQTNTHIYVCVNFVRNHIKPFNMT